MPPRKAIHVGVNSVSGLGEAEIARKENGLEVSAAFLDEPIFILPESDSTFFEKKGLTNFTFIIKDRKAGGFRVQRIE